MKMFSAPAACNILRLLPLLALTLISSIPIASAYLTFQTIRDLTSITDECTARIRSAGSEAARLGYLLPGKESSGQVPLGTAEDPHEVEDVCTRYCIKCLKYPQTSGHAFGDALPG